MDGVALYGSAQRSKTTPKAASKQRGEFDAVGGKA
jgi:hypothetical protein